MEARRIKSIGWTTVFAIGVLAITTTVLKAETLRTFKIANWSAGAYSIQGGRRFNHCAATTIYNSGILVSFAISRVYGWSMGFSHPQWRLTPGASFNIAFTVDNLEPVRAQASAITKNQIEVVLADSVPLFRKFMVGHELKVAAADKVFTFSLTDTSKVLPSLLKCVQAYVAPPPKMTAAEANPFLPATSTPKVEVPNHRAEAVTLLANILGAAGISGFQILDEASIKFDGAGWTAGKLFGALTIYEKGNAGSVVGTSIGLDAASCKSKFASGSLPKDPSGSLRAFTVCGDGEDAINSYYLVLPRRAGGHYLIAMGSIGERQPALDAEPGIRAAALKIEAASSR